MLAIIALLLVPYSAVAASQAAVTSDFVIHFEFGLCWRDIVDTGKDQYVRDLATGNGATRTVALRLSDSQLRQLIRWVDESRFFELPAELDAALKFSGVNEGGISVRMPSEKFLIDVQRSGVRHQVRFDDNGDATSGAVVRVRTLVQRLRRFFTQLPQVKGLPKPAVGCA